MQQEQVMPAACLSAGWKEVQQVSGTGRQRLNHVQAGLDASTPVMTPTNE